jgi:hypothetical protein
VSEMRLVSANVSRAGKRDGLRARETWLKAKAAGVQEADL